MRRRLILCLSIVVVLSLLLAACGQKAAGPEAPGAALKAPTKFSESPMLTALVKEKKLPALKRREP